jgi:hypothetical protein
MDRARDRVAWPFGLPGRNHGARMRHVS